MAGFTHGQTVCPVKSATCPLCRRPHDPDGYDVGWVFICPCGYLIVWEEGDDGRTLRLAEPATDGESPRGTGV
jgi:hypothetical protein